jgi:hypothetical protein
MFRPRKEVRDTGLVRFCAVTFANAEIVESIVDYILFVSQRTKL